MPEMEHPEAIGTATDTITEYASRKCRACKGKGVQDHMPGSPGQGTETLGCDSCDETGFQHPELLDRCLCEGKQFIEPEHIPFFCPYGCQGSGYLLAVTEGKLCSIVACFSLELQYKIARLLEEQRPLFNAVYPNQSGGTHRARRFMGWWLSLTDAERQAALCAALSVAEG